jgi:hypothetical protein
VVWEGRRSNPRPYPDSARDLPVCAPAAFLLPARLHPALPEPFLGVLPLPHLPGGFLKTSFPPVPAPC